MPTPPRAVFWIMLSAALLAPRIAFADDYVLSSKKDKNIRAALEKLLPLAEEMFNQEDTNAVVVVSQTVIETASDSYTETENKVWWIREGEHEDISNFVRDYEPGEKIDEVAAFRIRPGEFSREAILKAEVVKLGDDRIQIQKGDRDQRSSNLVISFEMLQPGDVVGISIRTKQNSPLYWRSLLVAGEYPVARSEIRVKSSRLVAYSLFGHRFAEGSVRKQVIDEKKGHIRDIVLAADKIQPIYREPYSPPDFLQSPRFLVVWRAQNITVGYDNRQVWWRFDSWNQVASRMANVEAQRLATRQAATAEAERITGGRGATAAVADDIHRFVTDELLDVSSVAADDGSFTVDEILAARTGNSNEKAYLMLSMLRAVGFEGTIAWTHHPNQGSFYIKFPNWDQVPHPLVVVTTPEGERWYDPGCRSCEPGSIRPKLRDAQAIMYTIDAGEKHDELIGQIGKQAYREGVDPFQLYFNTLQKQKWHFMVKTPGDPRDIAGWVHEIVDVGAAGGATCLIQARGINRARDRWEEADDSEAFANEWIEARFPELEAGGIQYSMGDEADTLAVKVGLSAPQPPPPAGDTWVLPAVTVYGVPSVTLWESGRSSDFYQGRSEDSQWEIRIPLPEGWQYAQTPRAQSLGRRLKDMIAYDVQYRVEDGKLVVRRWLCQIAGSIGDAESMKLLRDQVAAIYEIETSPVVLHRATEGLLPSGTD